MNYTSHLFLVVKGCAEPGRLFEWTDSSISVHKCAIDSLKNPSQVLNSEFFLLFDQLPNQDEGVQSALLIIAEKEKNPCLSKGNYCKQLCPKFEPSLPDPFSSMIPITPHRPPMYIYIYFLLVVFNGISILVGYFMPNPVFIYIYFYRYH